MRSIDITRAEAVEHAQELLRAFAIKHRQATVKKRTAIEKLMRKIISQENLSTLQVLVALGPLAHQLQQPEKEAA